MIKIIAFSGSLRTKSYNTMALKVAVAAIASSGVSVEVLDLKDFPMTNFDGDIEAQGIPQIVEDFKAKVNSCDGLLIASPEYNHSIPGVLKNVLDWASRKSPQLKDVFTNKTVALMTASNGSFGGARAIEAWLPVFNSLGLIVYPTQQPIPNAQNVFDETGNIVDPKMKERIEKFALGFSEFTQKHSG